jgi:hypothetical protein
VNTTCGVSSLTELVDAHSRKTTTGDIGTS